MKTNAGFESGFTCWTRVNQLGSEGAFFLQTATVSLSKVFPKSFQSLSIDRGLHFVIGSGHFSSGKF